LVYCKKIKIDLLFAFILFRTKFEFILNILMNINPKYIDYTKLRLSNEALDVLKENFQNANIIYLDEKLDHDGYDKYGPKSKLWDLHIIIELNNDYIFHDYHWEKWFSVNDEEKYELSYPMIKLSETTIKNIHYFKKDIKDNKFNEAYQKHIKKIR